MSVNEEKFENNLDEEESFEFTLKSESSLVMLKVARPPRLSAKLSNPQLNLTLMAVLMMTMIKHHS